MPAPARRPVRGRPASNGRGGGQQRGNNGQQQRRNGQQPRENEGPIPVLAMALGEVTAAVSRKRVTPTTMATFQAVSLLIRELRAKTKTEPMSPAKRETEMRRIEGLAATMARTAAQDGRLLGLLTDDAAMVSGTSMVLRELRERMGEEVPDEPEPEPTAAPNGNGERTPKEQVIPQSVQQRMLANPFLAPDFTAGRAQRPKTRLLADWELLNPLLRSFEESTSTAVSCMDLPEPGNLHVAPGLELMPHQSEVIEAAAEGHRTFLLADEPGLGKTAQALLAAQVAKAYPLLVVVPNVVKTSWAREAAMWTPKHPATVVHSDGDDVDAFSDIVIVNYDILDRHAGWLASFGFRGMVVDEAHFIKNKTSQRSKHVLELSRRIRFYAGRPLLMALTGTPLINDIEDFLAIWEFLGWIDEKEPGPELMASLEENGFTPIDPGFYPEARNAVIDMGIVRRRKVDVAKDIPARRIADMPVELEGALGNSIREAERKLVRRLVKRYESALAARKDGHLVTGIDESLVRTVCLRELKESSEDGNGDGENVFTMMRRIGTAKAELAADYTAQLSRNAGKVVFFAKHLDVMDAASAVFDRRGIGWTEIRGEQSRQARTKAIDAFVNDPDVQVIVCSLTAAGVGINLQVSSNVVLAELSWTAAEQTQAIDRVHRIGQDQPVTAWRIIAAQTIDARVAELIDSKAGLAARALDGSQEEISTVDVQLETLVALLTDALKAEPAA